MVIPKAKQKSQTEKGRIKPYTMQRSYKGSFPLIAVHSRLMLPIGIQITYLRFIVRMGYRRTPRQIARIHYLYREELAVIHCLAEEEHFAKLLENQQILKQPVVRNGKQATVGYCPEVWKKWD